MDKQIIIDRVDVSGCDFYDKNKKYCLTLKMNTSGFKNPSCFSGDFQECIQDSKLCPNTFCDNNHNCYYKQLKRKEQENNSLQAQVNNITVQSNNAITVLEQENEELKQTLTEIKEIAKKSYRTPLAEKDCIKCDDFLGQILQKISESEVE